MLHRMYRLLRSVLGIHPRVKANDGALVTFSWAVLFTFALGWFLLRAMTGSETARFFALPIILGLYVVAEFGHAIWSGLFYRHKVRVEAETNGNGADAAGLWRGGEYVGAGFSTFLILLITLTVYRVSVALPFVGTLYFHVLFEEVFVALAITVGILAGSSTVKLITVPSRPRLAHNTVLLFLCFAITVSAMAIFVHDARAKTSFPDDMLWLYAFVLSSYAAHNVTLRILCPSCRQRRPGHLAALSVALFAGAIVLFSTEFGLLERIPQLLFGFGAITMIILVASVAFNYFLEEPVVKALWKSDKNEGGPAS